MEWLSDEGKFLAIVPLGSHRALLLFDTRSGQPIPKELRIVAADSAADNERLLAEWTPPESPPLASSHLRNINLGRIQRDWLQRFGQVNRQQKDLESFSGDAYCRRCGQLTRFDGKEHESLKSSNDSNVCEVCGQAPTAQDKSDTARVSTVFRRPQDRKAAIERCAVSLRYEELTYEGVDNPTQVIAREFFNENNVKARNVVAAARQGGWLTAALPGRAFGEATSKSLQFARENASELAEYLSKVRVTGE